MFNNKAFPPPPPMPGWTSKLMSSGEEWEWFLWCKGIYLYTPSNCSKLQETQEGKKKRIRKWVIEVEHGTFTPIVLSMTSGWGPSASIMYKRLAFLISGKYSSSYSSTMRIIRTRITFSLTDSAIMCLKKRGVIFPHALSVLSLTLCTTPLTLWSVRDGSS